MSIPVIEKMEVFPVAGHDCMELNLSGAHSPYFTRNVVVLTASDGTEGIGEVPGGEKITKALEEKGDGFVKAMWCGEESCEDKVKELTGVGSRCIPFEQEQLSDVCVCCGKPAKHMVVWGKAY